MRYSTKLTSKGTITIAAPIRKALKLKPGQEINLELDQETNRVSFETGLTIEQFEKLRDELLSKYPKVKPLTGEALRKAKADAWVAGYENE